MIFAGAAEQLLQLGEVYRLDEVTFTKVAKRSVVGERNHCDPHARANDSRRSVDDDALVG